MPCYTREMCGHAIYVQAVHSMKRDIALIRNIKHIDDIFIGVLFDMKLYIGSIAHAAKLFRAEENRRLA